MTDRELLELAARAAGIKHNPSLSAACNGERIWWNPLTDDGDALMMAVKLRLSFVVNDSYIVVHGYGRPNLWIEHYEGDPYAATRRAIVRAAAEIGKESK